MKLHARFINEGATLIIDGPGFCLGVQTTDENLLNCEALARIINEFHLQHGEPNTRVAGLVREVGPWRTATDDERAE